VPFPGVDVAILPPADYPATTTRLPEEPPLPDGATGEICVRGENVFRGYVHDATGLPRRGDWLCTGDLGARNADGTVTFAGLRKPMFTRSGFNVYPREIERAVLELSGVTRADASPIPDAAKEHEIRLRYTGTVDEALVRAWCAERLSAYKQPSVVERSPSD
jgi:acyl-CoA synthetase (AMP-forming)/AMP-acid ligase II